MSVNKLWQLEAIQRWSAICLMWPKIPFVHF